MTPFDVSAPLPARGETTLLEASAGTGKTWTIGALVTRFVAEGAARLDEILVVTYTRAASAELRSRIREQMLAAQRALAGESVPADALIEAVCDCDATEAEARSARLTEAQAGFDAATIVTIHAFCRTVLSSLGVASDIDQRSELVADLDDVLDEVTTDLYLNTYADDPEPRFSFSDAKNLARAAVTGGLHIEPADADPTSEDGIRVGFAHRVRAELDRRKQQRRIMGYDDLLEHLADTLADPVAPARERIRRTWPVVLIDEFQDTDPTSWTVFDRAFSGHSAMVLIGDPKQSIYRFRGGDVYAYLTAAGTATHQMTLDTNYRSDPGVVEAVHTLLTGLQLGDPRIVVHPITAHRAEPTLIGAPDPAPVRVRGLLREDVGLPDKPSTSISMPTVRDRVFEDLALDVKRLLTSGARIKEGTGDQADDRPIEPRDVAVLAAVHSQLELARKALLKEGIPAVVSGNGSVFETSAALAWRQLLEALEAPHRVDRVRMAALSPFFGCTAGELAADEAVTDRVADRLRDMIEAYGAAGPAAVFELATADGLPARLLGRVGGERDYTDLRQVTELLHAAATRDRLGLIALSGWLAEQITHGVDSEDTERTRRLDSDDLAVQLVTIHASKGLQYPVVYLPAVADRWVRTATMPQFHDELGRRCIWVGTSGSPGFEAAKAKDMAEDAGESLRLLYVALTRAQCQVVAWWSPNRNAAPAAFHRVVTRSGPQVTQVPDIGGRFSDLDARSVLVGWADRGAFTLQRAAPQPVPTALVRQAAPELAVRSFDRDVDHDWRRTSYTSLSRLEPDQTGGVGSEVDGVGTDDEDLNAAPGPGLGRASAVGALAVGAPAAADGFRSPMDTQPAGAGFGSLVHAVLEHADPQALDLVGEMRAQIAEQLLRWPADIDAEALAEALAQVVTTPLGPLADQQTLAQIGMANRLAEMEFELPLDGGDVSATSKAAARVPTLGDLAPLLRSHLPDGDPVRAYVDQLTNPVLASRTLRGYLTGSIDVVLRVATASGPRYLVVDYKTNRLSAPGEPMLLSHYSPEALASAMGHSDYPLQALLYAVTLHRFLRWRQVDYDPAIHFGGVLYLYLRGMAGPDTPSWQGIPAGVFSWRPPIGLVEAVSALLDGSLLESPAGDNSAADGEAV